MITGFLEHWTRVAANAGTGYMSTGEAVFVKAHEGSEGRPVLHQIHCCSGRDLLAFVFALSFKTNSTCVFKIS